MPSIARKLAEQRAAMSLETPEALYDIQQRALDEEELQRVLQEQMYAERQFEDAPVEPSLVQADTFLSLGGLLRGFGKAAGNYAMRNLPFRTMQSGIQGLDDVGYGTAAGTIDDGMGMLDDAVSAYGDDAASWLDEGADLVNMGDDELAQMLAAEAKTNAGATPAGVGGTQVLDDVVSGADDLQSQIARAYERVRANPGDFAANEEFVRLQRLLNIGNGF